MSSYLEIRNMSHHFISNNEKLSIFQDLSFSLEKGEFLCILGASGCGKTTLLRCLAGFLQPTEGEIILEGNAITRPGRHCAMIFQTFDQLLPWKTVMGNVVYPLLVNKEEKQPKIRAKEQAEKYIDMVGLSKFTDYFPHQLSGGMKQRVAIARALVQQPSLIIMDEPFASLDADTRTALQKELLRIWKDSGVTILFVTHAIMESIVMSTKIMVLNPCPNGIGLYIDNPVEGERGVLRTPQSTNYADCWALLSNMIRKESDDKSAGE